MNKLACIFLLILLPGNMLAGDAIKPLDRKTIRHMTREHRQERVRLLENRLTNIKDMDLQNLSKAEKKDIKKEVKDIKRELKRQSLGGGVYISAGALIVILILLILLL